MLRHQFRARSLHRMSLYVTSVCNLSCEECIMKHIMAENAKYQMSLDEIEQFVYYSEKSGYSFDFVLTGGEPLAWKNMEEGLCRLRRSPITNKITMFTNAMLWKSLSSRSLECMDSIRISHYEGNDTHMAIMKEKFPDKVSIVDRTDFWVNPTKPVPNTTPAICLNPEHLYYDYRVYACPHSQSIARHNGSQVMLSEPLGLHFLDSMARIRHNQEKEICSMCISNQKVRNKCLKIHNNTGR